MLTPSQSADTFSGSSELFETCARAKDNGDDFPTIWRQILEPHPLVTGLPRQALDGDTPVLDVRLRTGQTLRFRTFGFHLI